MARPTFSATTERLYGRLPDLYRAADEAQATGPNGYPLLRYLSTLLDQAGEVEELLDRIDVVTPAEGGDPADTSHLADPTYADASWLPWLAQAAGVDLADVTDTAQRRELIAAADDNRAAGSLAALRASVRPLLTGDRNLLIQTHAGGDPFAVALITYNSETPVTSAELLAAAERQRPAGVALLHQLGRSWASLEAEFPTWGAIDAAGSWQAIT